MSAYSTGCVNVDRPYTIYHGEVCGGVGSIASGAAAGTSSIAVSILAIGQRPGGGCRSTLRTRRAAFLPERSCCARLSKGHVMWLVPYCARCVERGVHGSGQWAGCLLYRLDPCHCFFSPSRVCAYVSPCGFFFRRVRLEPEFRGNSGRETGFHRNPVVKQRLNALPRPCAPAILCLHHLPVLVAACPLCRGRGQRRPLVLAGGRTGVQPFREFPQEGTNCL